MLVSLIYSFIYLRRRQLLTRVVVTTLIKPRKSRMAREAFTHSPRHLLYVLPSPLKNSILFLS